MGARSAASLYQSSISVFLTGLALACGFRAQGTWEVESAASHLFFSEDALRGEAHTDLGGTDDTGSFEEPELEGPDYKAGFQLNRARELEWDWKLEGWGSASLYDQRTQAFVAQSDLAVRAHNGEDNDVVLYFDNDIWDLDSNTASTLYCDFDSGKLDCGDAVLVRAEPTDQESSSSASSGTSDETDDTGQDTGEPDDLSYWRVKCSGAPDVKCPLPKDLNGRHETTCEISRNDRIHSVDVRVNGDLDVSPGDVSVSMEVDNAYLEMDVSFSGTQTDANPFRFEGDCYGTVEEDGEETNLSEHEWGGYMEWREE